jgi:hypothetical protein
MAAAAQVRLCRLLKHGAIGGDNANLTAHLERAVSQWGDRHVSHGRIMAEMLDQRAAKLSRDDVAFCVGNADALGFEVGHG